MTTLRSVPHESDAALFPSAATRRTAVPAFRPPVPGSRRKQIVMSLSTSSGPAPDRTAARRASWWGDRGVRTKVLVAVGAAAAVAVVIGVLGLFSLTAAAARTQNLYDANLQGVTQAETM